MTASLHVLAGTPFCHTPDGFGRPLQYEAKDGGYTAYRVETSDRAEFALYKGPKECRNVQFSISAGSGACVRDAGCGHEARALPRKGSIVTN